MSTIKFHPNAKQLYGDVCPYGLNIFVKEAATLSTYTQFTNGFFNRYFLNDFDGIINEVAAAQIKAFLVANNAKMVLHCPLQRMYISHGNFNVAWLDFLRWQLSTYAGLIVNVQLDLETVQVQQGNAIGMTTDDYIDIVMLAIPIIVAAGLSYSFDDGLMSKNDRYTLERNQKLAALIIANILDRQYRQGNDDMHVVAGDTAGNLIKVNTYWNTTIPAYDVKFAGYFPNAKKQNLQTEIEDGVGKIISGKPLGNLWLGLQREYAAKHTDSEAGSYWMRAQNLFPKGVPGAEYTSLKRLAACQKYKYTCPVDIDLPNSSAVGFTDGVNDWSVLINHQDSTEHIFSLTDIKGIHHKSILGNVVCDSGSAVTWDSPQDNWIETLQGISVHSNSVTVAKFTTI